MESDPAPSLEPQTVATTPGSRIWIALAAVLGFGFAAVLVRLAWVGDDAYITLRTVENFVQGHGLVWNVGERVQTYTHPLWLFVLTAVRLLTGESYFGTIAVSWLLACASAAVLMRVAGRWAAAAAVAALLVGSRAFTEYAICGLENPLTYLLLAAFAAAATGGRPTTAAARTRWTALFAALAATTRLDLGLLCAPLLLANLRGRPFRGWFVDTALGMAPLFAWLLFATFYYGSPFPITAMAKATHLGIAAADLWAQGGYFYLNAWNSDPLTLLTIGAAVLVGMASGRPGCRPLALGIVLYGLYIGSIGGDFMGGRFFTPPFVVAVAMLARTLGTAAGWVSAATLAAATAATLWPGMPAWTHGPALDTPPTEDFHAILDERRAYYGPQGLLSPTRSIPAPGGLTSQLRAAGRQRPLVMIRGIAGRYPFEAGELLHAVDHCLLDPLQMRLPVRDPKRWRIGHFVREMPEGYLESIAHDRVLIRHEGLARYYGNLKTVIDARVPLFAAERLRALWALWTGEHAAGLADYVRDDYRSPPLVDVDGAALATKLGNGLFGAGPQWFDHVQARLVQRGGLRIRFPADTTASRLELQLQGGRDLVYRLRIQRDGKLLGEHNLDASKLPAEIGMQDFPCELPADQRVFDTILVDVPTFPLDMVAAVGSLRLSR